MINIVIVDDHAIVRSGIRQILSENKMLNIVGEASNYSEIIELLPQLQIDVLLLDINLPGRSGLDVLELVHQNYQSISILVLTMYPEEQYAIRAIKSGADGYLTKDTVTEELIEAIITVHSGKKYISKSLAEKMAAYLGDSGNLKHETLSNREYQIMIMLASGKSQKDIASDLFLSIKTINTYKTRLFEKMGFKTTADLVLYVKNHNLFSE